MSDYGLGVIIVLLLVAYSVSSFSDYFTEKHLGGSEGHTSLAGMSAAYGDGAPSSSTDVLGSDDGSFAPASAAAAPMQGQGEIQNPADLLPKNSNSDFSDLSPASANVNNDGLLNAGFHVGVGGSDSPLRNSNLQLRSEEPNPRTQSTGPWNQSTIEGDGMRRGLC